MNNINCLEGYKYYLGTYKRAKEEWRHDYLTRRQAARLHRLRLELFICSLNFGEKILI